jgi:Flp pilus assembly protein TadB|tara:strand:+ start:5869 stop:6168 length:300 start_codon:yes stop_codon:yes gene_type:complete
LKASSTVLVQVQRQMTFLGLAPRLLMVAGMVGSVGVVIGVAIDSPAMLLIGFVGGFLIAWLWLFRRSREDLHFERQLLTAPRFWRGARHTRQLSAGGER